MWVNHPHRFCYVGVPHTACTSVITWLREQFPPTERVGKKHDAFVPEGCDDYFFWAVYRDEERRLQAMYEKQFEDEDAHLSAAVCRPYGVVEKDRVKWGIARRACQHPMLMDQEDFLAPLTVEADVALHVVSFEELPESLLELPFVEEVVGFPHLNRRTG
jgi:hypothetical protein